MNLWVDLAFENAPRPKRVPFFGYLSCTSLEEARRFEIGPCKDVAVWSDGNKVKVGKSKVKGLKISASI